MGRSGIPSYWSIMTRSVDTRALVTLMRNAIWRERETSVIESPWHRSCYKRCNRAFPVWGIFSWRAEKLLASRLPIVTNTSKWSERSHGKKDTTFIILFYFVYKYIVSQGRISIGYSCWPCDSIMGKVMKLWIYENHICELRSEELNERRSSQVI